MAATEGMNRVPRIRAAVNRTRERVILSFRRAGRQLRQAKHFVSLHPTRTERSNRPPPARRRQEITEAARCQRRAVSGSLPVLAVDPRSRLVEQGNALMDGAMHEPQAKVMTTSSAPYRFVQSGCPRV